MTFLRTLIGTCLTGLFSIGVINDAASQVSGADPSTVVMRDCAAILSAGRTPESASEAQIAESIWRRRFEASVQCLESARHLPALSSRRFDLASVSFIRFSYSAAACARAQHGEGAAHISNAFMLSFMLPALRDDLNLMEEATRLQFADALQANLANRRIFENLDLSTCEVVPSRQDREFAREATSETVTQLARALPDPGSVGISTTWRELPEVAARVGVELRSISHLNEYERSLVVRRGDDSRRFDLITDWGPADWVGVYATPTGQLGIIQAEGTANLVDMESATLSPPGDPNTWRFLGAFDMLRLQGRRRVGPMLIFLPADERAECFQSFGSESRVQWRQEANRERCAHDDYELREAPITETIVSLIGQSENAISIAQIDGPRDLTATEPFIMVRRAGGTVQPADVLAIQVIDSIVPNARERSAQFLADAGVGEFWVVDPRTGTIQIMDDLRNGLYGRSRVVADAAQSPRAPNLSLRLADLRIRQ